MSIVQTGIVEDQDPSFRPPVEFDKRWYVVIIGLNPGVYKHMSDCQDQTFGVPHQKFACRGSEDDARTYFEECVDAQTVKKVVRSGERLILDDDHLSIALGLDETFHPNASNTDALFYVVTRGTEVGIFGTDATAFITGVREGLQVKTRGFTSAREIFMSELGRGRVIRNDLKFTLQPYP